ERIGKEAGNDGNEGIGVGLTEEGLLSDGRFNQNEGYEAGGSYDGVNAIETDDLVGSAYEGSFGEEEVQGGELIRPNRLVQQKNKIKKMQQLEF
ncbi:MAG: hypothetical protein EZS28_052376, partial [Streblomastix strix]